MSELNTPDESTIQGAGSDPSYMWGSSTILELNEAGKGRASAQLAQVQLPRAALCSVYIQAAILSDNSPGGFIQVFTINLYAGIGRVTVPRQLSFPNQPAVGAPLEFTIPFIPVHALQADVQARAALVAAGQEIKLQIHLQLAPLTHIPATAEEIKFGMALPGEADGLDDALLEELEEHAPSQVDYIRAQRERGLDVAEPEAEEERPRVQVPRRYQAAIDRIAQRLGRHPQLRDLPEPLRSRVRRSLQRGA